ncbi:hypothetical protein F0L46_25065 [Salinarimonas soli]|uniref:Uncharacterized protein n=2 Tax=Salinarimonas soli TaxID=1638099 RepID=A0A5B2UZG3_9HYPH|nr:hypothetical protein F0L46_25065 [Salinarimonas soli]
MLVLGIAFAVPAGAVVLVLGALAEPAARELLLSGGLAFLDALFTEASQGGAPELLAGSVAYGVWALTMTIVVAPPAFTALIGEVVGTRSFIWYGGACGLTTALLPWLMRSRGTLAGLAGAEGRLTALLFLSGAVAGLVYWLIAGRSAGPAPPPSPEGERGRG